MIIQKIQLRTKIQAGIIIFFLLILVGISVESLMRTITDTTDNVDTFIRNSNGKYWNATASNIQAAINDLEMNVLYESRGAPHGTVWLPGNMTIITSSTISIKPHVTLDMGGCVIKPNGNFDVVTLKWGSVIQNGCINVSGLSDFNKCCIGLYGWEEINCRNHPPKILDMNLISAGQRGDGILFYTGGSEWSNYIQYVDVHNIKVSGLNIGIHINHTRADSDQAFINANTFTDIFGYDCKYFIFLYAVDFEAAGNIFHNVQCYCTSNTECIIWNNGAGNMYDNIIAYNWDNANGTRTSYNFSVDSPGGPHHAAQQCYLSFIGGGEDIAIGAWAPWTPANKYTILNLEDSTLTIGKVYQLG